MTFLGQGGRVVSHSISVTRNWVLWMNVCKKALCGILEPGSQVSSFGCLGTIQVHLDACLAHVGYFLANAAKVGSKRWCPFPENTGPLGHPCRYWIGQVDLVNGKTSYFRRTLDKNIPRFILFELTYPVPGW
jgi:hypothetical protein